MAIFMQRQHHLTIFLLCVSLLLIQTTCEKTVPASPEKGGGFSLKLIHRHFSEESPFYNPNISTSELRKWEFNSDQARLRFLDSKSKSKSPMAKNCTNCTQTKVIRPPYYENSWLYSVMLQIGVGRNGRKTFRLHLDTGSGLTWVQCVACDPGFPTLHPLFEPTRSISYYNIGCNSEIFPPPDYTCVDNQILFHYEYGDRTYADGIIAKETFNIDTDTGDQKEYPYVYFGCAHNVTAKYPINGPEGILGMSLDPESFISRIKDSRDIHGRFSYCLMNSNSPRHGFLRFGDDIPELDPRIAQRTPFIPFAEAPRHYYLRVHGISIGDHYMNNINQIWWNRIAAKGGVIIDSGTTHTHLSRTPYRKVVDYLKDEYFPQYRLTKMSCEPFGVESELCYLLPINWLTILPGMTWHLEGTDFEVGANRMWSVDLIRCIFWLELQNGTSTSIIGVDQLINHRFIHDVNNMLLHFQVEECSNSP